MSNSLSALQSNFDLLLIGDSQTGKTSLLFQYIHSQFIDSLPSVEELYRKMIIHPETKKYYEFTFLDSLSSIDTYSSSRKQQIVNSRVIVLIYSIASEASFQSIEDHVNRIRSLRNDVPIMLVATCIDEDDNRQVSYEQGLELSQEIGAMGFVECSAKQNINVDEAFAPVIEYIFPQKLLLSTTPKVVNSSSAELSVVDSFQLPTDEEVPPTVTHKGSSLKSTDTRAKQSVREITTETKQNCCVIT